jgi:hypothetical protein
MRPLLRGALPGVVRRLLTFFVSPKKSKQKKGGRKTLAFGFPFVRGKKWEMKRTRCLCRAHIRLQADTVAQAQGRPRATPASPQTCFVSDPISASQQRQRCSREFVWHCRTPAKRHCLARQWLLPIGIQGPSGFHVKFNGNGNGNGNGNFKSNRKFKSHRHRHRSSSPWHLM